MTPGGYIAHLPLKYFSDLSMELFPGKLIRGRVISVVDGQVSIELGGARLEAQTTRNFEKGDSVTLKVVDITKNGISLEIHDAKARVLSQSNPSQVTAHIESNVGELIRIREQINKLLEMTSSTQKIATEVDLARGLKDLLQVQPKFDFFFLVLPLRLEDDKTIDFELLMRKIKSSENEDEIDTREFLFSVAPPRLGSVGGRILTVGKRMRIDLSASEKSTVDELKTLSEPLKLSLQKMGFFVASVNMHQKKVIGPIETQINAG